MVNSALQCRRRGLETWVGKEEKKMATHSTILAWEIPWTEEPGGLQSQMLGLKCWTQLTHTRIVYIIIST